MNGFTLITIFYFYLYNFVLDILFGPLSSKVVLYVMMRLSPDKLKLVKYVFSTYNLQNMVINTMYYRV